MAGAEGHNMTTIDGGSSDGSQDTSNAENNNAQPQPRNTAGIDRGGENQAAPSGGGQDEDQNGEEGEGAETETELDAESPLDGESLDGEDAAPETLDPKAITEMIQKSVQEALDKNKPVEKPIELSEEQWAQKEQEFGVPRSAIQAFTAQSMKVYNAVQDMLDARFAKIEKAEGLRSLAREKGFEDAMRYPKGVEAYLSQFDPKYHSNPTVLKNAVIHARGLAASKNVQRARVESEKNRRITGAARPSSPGSSSGAARKPGNNQQPLNATQKQVADRFGMSPTEYSNLRAGRGKPIAV